MRKGPQNQGFFFEIYSSNNVILSELYLSLGVGQHCTHICTKYSGHVCNLGQPKLVVQI
jgi:hypothetical protein